MVLRIAYLIIKKHFFFKNHYQIRNGRRGLKSFQLRSNVMYMKTDVLIKLKSSFTSKLNIIQQALVLDEVEMG